MWRRRWVRSSRRRPEPAPPTFFIDRGLGKHHVPTVFVTAGFSVVLMSDAYADDGQLISDDAWIDRAPVRVGWP